MDGNKLEVSGKADNNLPAATATYRVIPEADMEEEAVTRPKSLVKLKTFSPEADGADEKMLPKEECKINANSNIGVGDVKISPLEKQNGDAKLDIGELKSAFVGMGKEELMKYANDPFWVRLRWFLFITFWVLWATMLLGAVMIIYAAPKCNPPPPRTWWEHGPLAEIEGADYEKISLKDIKNEVIPGIVVPWPEDTYSKVDDSHQFIQFLGEAKEKGINVIVELEPAASDRWFQQSSNNDVAYKDYYIWKNSLGANDSGSPLPPNNWISPKNVSSWKYSTTRKEFYYSPGTKPQLNFRNQNVTEEFSEVIKFILSKGASGVRIRGAPNLLVDPKFEDEVRSTEPDAPKFVHTEYGFYKHSKTENLADLGSLLKQWREVVKNTTENGLFTVSEHLHSLESYRVNNSLVVDLPVEELPSDLNGPEVIKVLNETFISRKIEWPLWKHKSTSLPSDVWDIFTFLLPGTPVVAINSTVMKDLLITRHTPPIMRGGFYYKLLANETVLAYQRLAPGNPGILVAVNPTSTFAVVDFVKEMQNVPAEVTVQHLSRHSNNTQLDFGIKTNSNEVPLAPLSAVVLSYIPKSKDDE